MFNNQLYSLLIIRYKSLRHADEQKFDRVDFVKHIFPARTKYIRFDETWTEQKSLYGCLQIMNKNKKRSVEKTQILKGLKSFHSA